MPSLAQATPAIPQPLTGRGAGRGPTVHPLGIHNQEELGSSLQGPLWNQSRGRVLGPQDKSEQGPEGREAFLCFSEAVPYLGSRRPVVRARLQSQKAGSKSWLCLLGCVTLDKTCDPLAASRDVVRIKYDAKHIARGMIESALLKSSRAWSLEAQTLRAKLPGFKSQLYHFLAMRCGQLFNLSVPQLPYL